MRESLKEKSLLYRASKKRDSSQKEESVLEKKDSLLSIPIHMQVYV
jgi:hypothetical protein